MKALQQTLLPLQPAQRQAGASAEGRRDVWQQTHCSCSLMAGSERLYRWPRRRSPPLLSSPPPPPPREQSEASDVFFSVTKLFQHKDVHLRRMVYLIIKEIIPSSDEVIIITRRGLRGGCAGTWQWVLAVLAAWCAGSLSLSVANTRGCGWGSTCLLPPVAN